MTFSRAVVILAFLILLGCKGKDAERLVVNIAVQNNSTNDYWVNFKWAGPGVPVGILSIGKSATAVGVDWPNLPSANLELKDDKTKEQYTLEVSFSAIVEQIKAKKCETVTVHILSRDKANVTCE